MFKKFKAHTKAFFDSKLPFEILEEFRPLEQKYLDEKGSLYPEVNEKLVVIDLTVKMEAKIYLGLALVLAVAVIIGGTYSNEGLCHPVFFLILSICFLAIIYYSFEISQNRDVDITLQREKGLITFPVGIRKNKVYTSLFHKIIVHWYGTGGSTGNLDMRLVANHPDKKGGLFLEGLDRNYRKLWSFYIWYMDKNRPLPPGSAFDPYRQKDFERRKAEGFPNPLYRSQIPTPEATPAQQAEREKYWTDKLETFSREPNSLMYDPDKHQNWFEIKYSNQEGDPIANTFFRFKFDNGEIIYMKTDEKGSGFEPQGTEKFTTTIIKTKS